MDQMVLKTQKYLNENYNGKHGYNTIAEDGATGWSTIYALTRAFQIELGLSAPADNFGNASTNAFKKKYPTGIKQQDADATETSRVYAIIQGALWCKGYGTGSNEITEHFYGGTGAAVKKLKTDAGFETPDSTVTLNVMKALLSMDQFRVIYSQGGTITIQNIQKQLNRKYESYIGLIPCDGLYGRQMNKALIQVLQAIVGLSADGAFGNQTKAKCPILPDVDGLLPSNVVADATVLVKWALSCNGYVVDTSADWDNVLEMAIREFQRDLHLQVTGTVNIDTWMSLLLSKGNPDRACSACDTRFKITYERADELKKKGYSIVGRYLTGGDYKELEEPKENESQEKCEPQRILSKGLSFFPIFQESSTDISYFTEARGKIDAGVAVRAARRHRVPEGTVIYFAVDLDATSPQITKYILPYFKLLRQNIDTAYLVGIYGTRNVCTQVCDAGYAITCFVSDMSTGYSGNMGFRMPNNWNFDQYAEISMGNGDWAIDKDAYAGKFEPVKALDFYEQPSKTSVPKHPTILEILPLVEQLEDLYVEWYTPLFLEAPEVLPYLSPLVLARGITNFFRSIAYNDIKWKLSLSAADEGFVNYVKEHDMALYQSVYPYMRGSSEDAPELLISDGGNGVVDLKHLAATAEGYFTRSIAPDSWYGWAADLATAIVDAENIASQYESIQQAADIVIGDSEYSFSFEDICSDADAIKVAQLVLESSSTTHSFSEALNNYFCNYVDKRFYYLLADIGCLDALDDAGRVVNLTLIKAKIAEGLRVRAAKTVLLVASILAPGSGVIKDEIERKDATRFKEILEQLVTSPAYTATCNSFARYIYCELE